MPAYRSSLRSPVRRAHADQYLLVTLLVFAATVSLTRLFLTLTGYPQMGGGEIHIAHLLWGGLLLFLAALLPLVIANRWTYFAGAIAAGGGAGLFIDEVGKFITRTNDYFYPPAAPIIYTFFLLVLVVYFQIRRPPSRDPRAGLYGILDDLQEVLDHDLEPAEREAIESKLSAIARSTHDESYARLAGELIHFLQSRDIHVAPEHEDVLERAGRMWDEFEKNHITRNRWKAALAGGYIALSVLLLDGFVTMLYSALLRRGLPALVGDWIAHGMVRSPFALEWFLAQLTLEGVAGSMLLATAILLLVRADRLGITLGMLGLLLNLAGINLLSFYFDQFSTILPATIEFLLLLSTLRYRRAYLSPRTSARPMSAATAN
jgi:hypothetical protein